MAISRCWSARRFRRVRAQLAERDVWLAIARMCAPDAVCDPRAFRRAPAMAVGAWLWLYDLLGSRNVCRPRTVDVTHHPLAMR